MNIETPKQYVDVEKYKKRLHATRHDFLTSYGVTGIMIILEGKQPIAIWTDCKTPGYKNTNLVGRLIFRGGSWSKKTDKTLIDTLVTETKEELRHLL